MICSAILESPSKERRISQATVHRYTLIAAGKLGIPAAPPPSAPPAKSPHLRPGGCAAGVRRPAPVPDPHPARPLPRSPARNWHSGGFRRRQNSRTDSPLRAASRILTRHTSAFFPSIGRLIGPPPWSQPRQPTSGPGCPHPGVCSAASNCERWVRRTVTIDALPVASG